MSRTAIISVDGHVRGSRASYRTYIEQQYLDMYDDWVRAQEELGLPDAGNMQPAIGVDGQWDSDKRLRDLESQGVVAEVLFPNGLPFQSVRFEDAVKATDPELDRQARRAYNRWLADFCAQAPGRRAGQALVSFDDVDEAVRDIRWAKENGLGGIMMPALLPGGTFFFDPVLDPVWHACEEVGLPISQHGGTGAPAYDPPGFAAIMTLAMEHSFYSGRSLWQLIVGGVFDRFPDLHVVFVETEVDWIEGKLTRLDQRMRKADEWMGFARHMNRDSTMRKTASDYWVSNCSAGISPFSIEQIPISGVLDHDDDAGFVIGTDRAMFGVDYPHFESIFPNTSDAVASLVDDPSVTDEIARKILCDNATRIYGFDLAALQPDIERAGFEAVA